jgi:2-oxoglutarate dehydrogenase E2 component (dihydrolipoamide succinyltransferase)
VKQEPGKQLPAKQESVKQEPGKQAPAPSPSARGDNAAAQPREPAAQLTPAAPREARDGERVVPMSPIRRRIAQRLVEAHANAALVTTFNEIDMSVVMALRKKYRDAFQQQYGVKLGFMSFFVKAVVEALAEIPQVNAEVRGTDVVFRDYYDIGIAVGSGKGLVVPVLRDAQRLSFAEIERQIADFARRAGENKLKLEELQGGTFTISNGGVYGSLLSTPIVNPPQSGVLGMHTIQERPVVRDGEIVIRSMMYVALTYDHRVIDGREAVTFLNRVREIVEDPSRLLIEV